MDKIIAYEISKRNGKSKEQNFKNGLFNVWTMERITRAFNNGNGTLKDFKTFMENNKQYVYFIVIKKYFLKRLDKQN